MKAENLIRELNSAPISLLDKYMVEKNFVQLTGTQALLRLLVERYKSDQRKGIQSATFISGYPGSPLGGFDSLLVKEKEVLSHNHIVFRPGINEEIAVTAVMGSQIANAFSDVNFDGVCGLWFGKTPGLDRALDGLKHANYVGTGKLGGALAVVGDDQGCKSSTIPNSSEYSFLSAHVPIFYPGNVQEVIELGLAAFAMSRYAGLWAGLKLVAEVADGGALVELKEDYVFKIPAESDSDKVFEHRIKKCFPPDSIQEEVNIAYSKLNAAKAFIRENNLNRCVQHSVTDRIGIVVAGKTYYDLISALHKLGIHQEDLYAKKIRLLKLNVIWPLDNNLIVHFAQGLEKIVVIEEKHPFIENQIKSILFNQPCRPQLYGKEDSDGLPLFPLHGDLSSDFIAERLQTILGLSTSKGLSTILKPKLIPIQDASIKREPWFCSGCPHNRSTQVPSDAVVGGGIGCHTLSIFMDRKVEFMAQMGGEGAAWIGVSPFVATPHIFQNVGDGTFFHSASLALRAAVTAGVNLTYKILYNGAVSMTGGQKISGGMSLASLSHFLVAEGVASIDIVTEDEANVKAMMLHPSVRVHPRTALNIVQEKLRTINGVSVIVYDQKCALEKRRDRKRSGAMTNMKEVYVSKEICDACGDCATKSNCISLGWEDTALGRKIKVQQPTCNQDYSCVEGECPSFFYIETSSSTKRDTRITGLIPEPNRRIGLDQECRILLAGVGGTGVITAGAILSHACWIESKHNTHLDQTGMAQKGGAVVTHLTISKVPTDRSVQIGIRECDVLIGFDWLAVQTRALASMIDPANTHVVLNVGETVAARQIGNPSLVYSVGEEDRQRMMGFCSDDERDRFLCLDLNDPAIAQSIHHTASNLFLVGVAFQRGLLPLKSKSIEEAIRLNKVSVEENLYAFHVGRQWACDREVNSASSSISKIEKISGPLDAKLRKSVESLNFSSDLNDTIYLFVQRLHQYSNLRYALEFIDAVRSSISHDFAKNFPEITLKVVQLMFKFRYVKDEYEVARLALLVKNEIKMERNNGKTFSIAANVSIPFLRPFIGNRKIRLPEAIAHAVFQILSRLRIFRHSPLDLFALGAGNRRERGLVAWFDQLVFKIVNGIGPANVKEIGSVLDKIDQIRGYGAVKRRRIEEIVPEVEKKLDMVVKVNHSKANVEILSGGTV